MELPDMGYTLVTTGPSSETEGPTEKGFINGGMADRSWDTSVWVSDPRAIRRDLGWEARTSFADGFARTVDWLRARPAVLAAYRARLRA